MTPAEIETLAAEVFQRVRDNNDGVLARHGECAVNLAVVSGHAAEDENGVRLTIQLHVYEGWTLRDVKEQELYCVAPVAEDEQLEAYFEGVARSMKTIVQRDVDVLMPHDLFPTNAFVKCTTAEQFEAACLAPRPTLGEVDIGDLSGTEPIAVNEELELAIANGDQPSALVYADWLSERGDPRGELIMCTRPDAESAQRRRAGAILANHERYLAGNLLSEAFGEVFRFTWENGFLRDANLRVTWEVDQEQRNLVERALRTLMTLRSGRLLRTLAFGCFSFQGDNDYTRLFNILKEGGVRPALRWLSVGDIDAEESEISWINGGNYGQLAGLYPNLERLWIRAGSMELRGGLDYPKLQSLSIVSGGTSQENVRAIAEASFPELRHLEIWFGSSNYGSTSTIDDLAPIFEGTKLPKLEYLGLRNCEYTDEICNALITAPVADQVQTLDLSMGTMSDVGAEALLKRRTFKKLHTLDVSSSYVKDRLEALRNELKGITLNADGQRSDAEEDRYVSLSE